MRGKRVKISDEIKEKIIQLYNKGYGCAHISDKTGISSNTILRRLKEWGIPIKQRGCPDRIKYDINEAFFSSIDTEEKAYFLGIIFADGSIIESGRVISMRLHLTERDKPLLEKLREVLNFDKPLHKINFKGFSDKPSYLLQIDRRKTVEDLIRLGAKTKDEIPGSIPKHLIRHFIRGVFDGDGCISVWRESKTGRQQAAVSILSKKDFAIQMREILKKAGIKFSTPRKRDNIYEIRVNGRLNLVKFFSYLYKDSTIYLERKQNKFIQIEGCDPFVC